jgi:hypothetical protein
MYNTLLIQPLRTLSLELLMYVLSYYFYAKKAEMLAEIKPIRRMSQPFASNPALKSVCSSTAPARITAGRPRRNENFAAVSRSIPKISPLLTLSQSGKLQEPEQTLGQYRLRYHLVELAEQNYDYAYPVFLLVLATMTWQSMHHLFAQRGTVQLADINE